MLHEVGKISSEGVNAARHRLSQNSDMSERQMRKICATLKSEGSYVFVAVKQHCVGRIALSHHTISQF